MKRKIQITFISLLVLVFLSGCATFQIKKDITPDEIARIAINGILDEELDLLTQCRQYAAVSPVFKETLKVKLIPIFEEISRNIDLATGLLAQGQPEKINFESARMLLRGIALELAKAKGGK